MDACENYINLKKKGFHKIELLLKCKDTWLPSFTLDYPHLDNSSSNRVEGFFGDFKKLLAQRVRDLSWIIRAMNLSAEKMYKASKRLILKDDIPVDLISENDSS